jgi:uncharacterized protein (TIGR03067 family)
MKMFVLTALVPMATIANAAFLVAADQDKEDAIKQERKKYQGSWRVILLQVDGNQVPGRDAKKIMVSNQADGTWSVKVDGMEVARGTSEIEPGKTPKTVDFTPTAGSEHGKHFRGIYDIRQNCRKICFAAAGKDRPSEFASRPGSGHILAIFQREKP